MGLYGRWLVSTSFSGFLWVPKRLEWVWAACSRFRHGLYRLEPNFSKIRNGYEWVTKQVGSGFQRFLRGLSGFERVWTDLTGLGTGLIKFTSNLGRVELNFSTIRHGFEWVSEDTLVSFHRSKRVLQGWERVFNIHTKSKGFRQPL